MTEKITRDESRDIGVHLSMLTGLDCDFWGTLDKDDWKHERYVPYVDFVRVTKERDALKLELDKCNAGKSDPIRGFCDSFFGVQP